MGGNIQVESREGEGSSFWFTIVLDIAVDYPESIKKPQSKEYIMRPLHILVAEDNKVNQIFLRELLQNAGHTVDIVSYG